MPGAPPGKPSAARVSGLDSMHPVLCLYHTCRHKATHRPCPCVHTATQQDNMHDSGTQPEESSSASPFTSLPEHLLSEILSLAGTACQPWVVCKAWRDAVAAPHAMAAALVETHGSSSALHRACAAGKVKVVRRLIQWPDLDMNKQPIQPNDGCSHRTHSSALRAAAVNGHTEVVKLLLWDPSAARHLTQPDTQRVLLPAVVNSHVGVVAALLSAPAACAAQPTAHALRAAARNGCAEMVHVLLAHGACACKGDVEIACALCDAAAAGHMDIVRLLLSAPGHAPTANCLDSQPLLEAVQHGHADVAQLLLTWPNHPARANCQRGAALRAAAAAGPSHTHILSLLKEHSPPEPHHLLANGQAMGAGSSVHSSGWCLLIGLLRSPVDPVLVAVLLCWLQGSWCWLLALWGTVI